MASLLPPQHKSSTMKPADYDSEMAGGAQGVPRGLPVYSAEASVRAGFIRKVYGILGVQMALTVTMGAAFMLHAGVRGFVLTHGGMLTTASIMPFPFLLGLFCYKDRHPLNLGLLAGFTVAMGYTVGVICAAYYQSGYGNVVLEALALTGSVFVGLSAYVHVTKKDFSFLGAGLFACLWILIIWSLLGSFMGFGEGGRMVFALVGALVFVGYILYDTSMMLHHMGPDDYVLAAVTLYLDIVNLFLYLLEILRMLQGGNNN